MVGNPIEVGDLVHAELKSNSVVGVIIAHEPGSTLGIRPKSGGSIEENVTPGVFILRVDIPFGYDPRESKAHGCYKVVKPPDMVKREAEKKLAETKH